MTIGNHDLVAPGLAPDAKADPPVTLCHILTASAAEVFARTPVGKFVTVLDADAAPTPFTRLDCFDQSLRRTDRMLLEIGHRLELILPQGQTITQTVAHRPRRAVDLAEGPVRQALADMLPLRSLLQLGSGLVHQVQLAFTDQDGKARCRAHLLSLTNTEGAGATLVRLQGLRGYDKALATLRQHLQDCDATEFSMQTLHDLLFPSQSVYRAKPPMTLTPDQSSNEAATQIIASHLPVLVQNEAGILADLATEFLQDYRVALRKIRSVLGLFKGVYPPNQTAALKARFSALMARTGPLRDLDVHLLEKQNYYSPLPTSLHAGLDAIFALRSAQRAKALTHLTRHLKSPAHAAEMTCLSRLFAAPTAVQPGPKSDTPVQAVMGSLIWKRFKSARHLAGSIGADVPDAAVHDLRLHGKKLRYLMECSASLYPMSPCFRHRSAVGKPASCSLIIPIICASMKRLFLISPAPSGWADSTSDRGNFRGAGQSGADASVGDTAQPGFAKTLHMRSAMPSRRTSRQEHLASRCRFPPKSATPWRDARKHQDRRIRARHTFPCTDASTRQLDDAGLPEAVVLGCLFDRATGTARTNRHHVTQSGQRHAAQDCRCWVIPAIVPDKVTQ